MHHSAESGVTGMAGALDPAYETLKTLVVDATGHTRLSARNDLLLEKVQRRLRSHGLVTVESYLDFLQRGAAGRSEFERLIAELMVGETSFFRHPAQFAALRDHVLPACVRRNKASKRLRIWSAGCANGAETYSIAILVHAALGQRIAEWDVTVLGTDINRAFLEEAEEGVYSEWTLRGLSQDRRPAFFSRQGRNWKIRDGYKRHVRFRHHNLISRKFPFIYNGLNQFDIIFCRNVMIYFDEATNFKLAGRLREALDEDGWLFTGPTDFNPRLDEVFATERPGSELVYRKTAKTAAARQPEGGGSPAATSPPARRKTAPASGQARARPSRTMAGEAAAAAFRRAQRSEKDAANDRTEADAARAEGEAQDEPSLGAVVACADKGDWAGAKGYCRRLLEADACNAAAHYYHALVQLYSAAPREAEQALKRAIYLDRHFALAHYQLGLLLKEAGDHKGCRRSFHNAIRALSRTADGDAVSPCGRITALELRVLALQQLKLSEEE